MSTDIDELAALDKQLQRLRADYELSLQEFLAKANRGTGELLDAFNKFHDAGVKFFNAHDRAIPLDSRLNADLNPTCYTDRAETSANVLETICHHYGTVRHWGEELGIAADSLRPSLTAFANMQRRVAETQPDIAAQLRAEFVRLELPARGFDSAELTSQRAKIVLREKPITNHFHGPATGLAIGDGATVNINGSSIASGENQMGDNINIGGDVTGSAVGSQASLKARDIFTAVKKSTEMDEDLRQKLTAAAKELLTIELAECDKSDAADDLAKLTAELDKPNKDEGRIVRLWRQIKEVAPTVASILSSAASLGKILDASP